MKILKHLPRLLAFLSAVLFLVPAHAQEAGDGRGIVRITADNLPTALYPLNCASGVCQMLQSLLYPRLFDIESATGALLTADESDRALVEAITLNGTDLPAGEITLELQQERLWSDDQPVDAYDVLFSMMVYSRNSVAPLESVIGARIIGDHTVRLRFVLTDEEVEVLPPDMLPPMPTCDALSRANIPLLPSHFLAPAFRRFVDESILGSDTPALDEWIKSYEKTFTWFDFSMPTGVVTSGKYEYNSDESENSAQFTPTDKSGTVLESVSTALSPLNAFIAGETNLLLDVPTSQRALLRTLTGPNTRNFQTAELPGRSMLVVMLNFADPTRPLPAFHPETGAAIDQGQHPIFSDLRVRRALQLAIDPNAIISGPMQGSAVQVGGLLPPASWGFDSSLAPLQPNIDEAKRLLDEAGWQHRGEFRRCIGCATAEEDASLQFTLMTSGNYEIADMLARQWREIGVSVSIIEGDAYALSGQRFDAFLLREGDNFYEAADPDRSLMLTTAGDTLEPTGDLRSPLLNFGSYHNDNVEALAERARTLPGCNPVERAALYHELERMLQEDLPFLSVVSPNEFYAAAPNVLGFAPRSGDALWNMNAWVVAQ